MSPPAMRGRRPKVRTALSAAKALKRSPAVPGRDRALKLLLSRAAKEGPTRVEFAGLELWVDLGDSVGRSLWLRREALLAHALTLGALCRPGDVVIDVGANVGYTSLIAGRAVGSAGLVFSLEPSSAPYELLEANSRLAENIRPLRLAAGAVQGIAELSVSGTDSDTSSLQRAAVLNAQTAERVPMATLEQLCRDKGVVPDVVKVDVEGGEWDVLRGLGDHRPRSLMVEVNPRASRAFGYAPSDMCSWLQFNGYELTMTDGSPYMAKQVDSVANDDVIASLVTDPESSGEGR